MKEYVGEQETGFCHPKPKWSSSAGAIDHKADHLLSSRKPHPTLGWLCCWRALGWDKQVWRKCDSPAGLEKLHCFIAFVLSTYSGCLWVGWRIAWEGGRHFPVNPSDCSFNIQSLSGWSFNLPSLNSTYTWLITAEIPSGVSSLQVYYSFVYFFININCCYLCKPVHLAQFWWALKAPNWK